MEPELKEEIKDKFSKEFSEEEEKKTEPVKTEEEKEKEIVQEQKKITVMILSVFGFAVVVLILAVIWFLSNKMEVNFNFNDGRENKTVYLRYSEVIKKSDIPTVEEMGPAFKGWYLVEKDKSGKNKISKEEYNFNRTVTSNINLVAVYDDNSSKIVIRFDTNGGSKIDSVILEKNEKLVLPKNPVRKGYTFKGWEEDTGIVVYDNSTFEQNTTLYAVWEKNDTSLEVEYYCEDGYTLDGKECVKTDVIKGSSKCPDGYRSGSSTSTVCKKEEDVLYRCRDYLGFDASSAILDATDGICYYDLASATSLGFCQNEAENYYNGGCYKAKSLAEAYCNKGELENNECVITVKKDVVCPKGYTVSGVNCVKMNRKKALER